MSKSIPQKRQALHFTTFVKLTIWPLIVLLVCCMALSLKLYFDIGKKTENLTDETVNSLLLSQRTAVNLEGLRFSLDIIANASEAERARDAYVNAWAMLSESALDRHDDTRLVVKQVLESLQQTWQERKALDADFLREPRKSVRNSAKICLTSIHKLPACRGLPNFPKPASSVPKRLQINYAFSARLRPKSARLALRCTRMPIPA